MEQKNWLDEIDSQAKSMGFGKVTFEVTRHRNITSKMEVISQSKIKYTENERVFSDLERLLNNLIDSQFTGRLQLEVNFDEGAMTLLTIKNKKMINYRDKK